MQSVATNSPSPPCAHSFSVLRQSRRRKPRPPALDPIVITAVNSLSLAPHGKEGPPLESRFRLAKDACLACTLDTHRVGSLRGEGVFGVVYIVPHPADANLQIAVKANRNRAAYDMLRHEAESAMAFDHARLLRYRGFAARPNPLNPLIHIYMDAMEYSLAELIETKRPSVHRTLALLRDIAQGLEELHRQGKVHNDIKADNILLDKQGRAVVADFGRTQEGLAQLDQISPVYPPEMEPFNPQGLELSDCCSSPDSGVGRSTPVPHSPAFSPALLGRIDMYGLGYIGLQLLSGKRFPMVWSNDSQGHPVSYLPAIMAPLMKNAGPHDALLPECLTRLIEPCLSTNLELRPCASEAIAIIDSLLSSVNNKDSDHGSKEHTGEDPGNADHRSRQKWRNPPTEGISPSTSSCPARSVTAPIRVRGTGLPAGAGSDSGQQKHSTQSSPPARAMEAARSPQVARKADETGKAEPRSSAPVPEARRI